MKKRKVMSIVLSVVLVMGLLFMTGCGSSPAPAADATKAPDTTKVPDAAKAPEAAKKIKIGVTLQALTHVFYQDMEKAIKAKASELEIDVQIVSAEWDAGKCISQIEDFTAQKVDAIIVCPPDSKAVAPAVEKADAAGIPVFTVDIAAEGAPTKSHIASNNVMGGQIAGKMMADALKGKKGTCIIVDQAGITSVADRVKGFEDAMADSKDIKLVKIQGEGKRDKAMAAAEDSIQKFGDQLVGMFGINDDSALGSLAAVEAANKVGKIQIVGYDATPQAQEAIKAGKMVGDTVQFPDQIGIIGLQMAVDYVKGVNKNPEKLVPVDVGSFRIDGVYDSKGTKIK